MNRPPLLELTDLHVRYRLPGLRARWFHAVNGVTISVDEGKTLGVVGESGSGKSTIARAVLGLVTPSSGTIRFEGRDITRAGYRERRGLAEDLSVVFQDPYSSLNPALTIGAILREPLLVQGRGRAEADATIRDMLEHVGLPADTVNRYPRQFSGGQRQRIAIARALVLTPKLIICDEPVSALDLSIQAQIINLLNEIQERLSLAMLFVAHDLSVVRHVADETAVMLRGQVMELGDSQEVHDNPKHPYTVALLAAAPVPDVDEQARRRTVRRTATRPSTASLAGGAVPGCPFAPRCPHRMPVCVTTRPALGVLPSGVAVACHLYDESRANVPSSSDAVAQMDLRHS